MARVSRSTILTTILVLALLASLPSAIRRLSQSGDLYLFSQRFYEDMLARLSGAGRLRFILQPTFAILLGIRHGLKDARAHMPPFLWAMAFHPLRTVILRDALSGIRDLIAVAILLDMVFQMLILHRVHPAAALLLGPVLIGFPYSIARAVANRVTQVRSSQSAAPGAH
jgi:hypothetical protein